MASLGAQVRTWLTGILNTGTAPIRGEAVSFNTATDANQMILCQTAKDPKFAGVAYEAPAGVGKDFRVVRSGICLVKVNASTGVSQSDPITTTSTGRFGAAGVLASGSNLIAGTVLEDGATGDLVAADINPVTVKLT